MDFNIIKYLPHLRSRKEEEVNAWYEEFIVYMQLRKIKDKETQFLLTLLVSEGEARKIISQLRKEIRNTEYPTLEEVKEILICGKKTKEIDYYNYLKSMKIRYNEDLIEFNEIYMSYYNKLTAEFKEGIKVKDYLNSIAIVRDACLAIIYEDVNTIEEACCISNKIQCIHDFEECSLKGTEFNYSKYLKYIKKKDISKDKEESEREIVNKTKKKQDSNIFITEEENKNNTLINSHYEEINMENNSFISEIEPGKIETKEAQNENKNQSQEENTIKKTDKENVSEKGISAKKNYNTNVKRCKYSKNTISDCSWNTTRLNMIKEIFIRRVYTFIYISLSQFLIFLIYIMNNRKDTKTLVRNYKYRKKKKILIINNSR